MGLKLKAPPAGPAAATEPGARDPAPEPGPGDTRFKVRPCLLGKPLKMRKGRLGLSEYQENYLYNDNETYGLIEYQHGAPQNGSGSRTLQGRPLVKAAP